MVVAGDTTAVLGRTMAFTAHADRVRPSRFRRQHFLHGDAVLPAVTEVIGVHRLGADLAKYIEQPRRALVADGRQTREPVVGIWFPEPPWTDAEVMQVTVLPPHGQLQHVVQLLQALTRRERAENVRKRDVFTKVMSAGTNKRRQIGGVVPSKVTLS